MERYIRAFNASHQTVDISIYTKPFPRFLQRELAKQALFDGRQVQFQNRNAARISHFRSLLVSAISVFSSPGCRHETHLWK